MRVLRMLKAGNIFMCTILVRVVDKAMKLLCFGYILKYFFLKVHSLFTCGYHRRS
jgi:hypothetical protein